MKPRSDATQLRYAKVEIRKLRADLAEQLDRYNRLRSAGVCCANICYNLGHRENASDGHPMLPEHERETCLRALTEWDAAVKRQT
jgi:hypothetical protein